MKVILDSSAILSGLLQEGEEDFFVTREIIDEIKDPSRRLSLEISIEQGEVLLFHPSEKWLNRVFHALEGLGERNALSAADVSILSAGLELIDKGEDVLIVTDDYGIQNACRHLFLKYKPVGERGISKRLEWIYLCRACGKSYEDKMDSCSFCGSPVKRRAKRKNY